MRTFLLYHWHFESCLEVLETAKAVGHGQGASVCHCGSSEKRSLALGVGGCREGGRRCDPGVHAPQVYGARAPRGRPHSSARPDSHEMLAVAARRDDGVGPGWPRAEAVAALALMPNGPSTVTADERVTLGASASLPQSEGSRPNSFQLSRSRRKGKEEGPCLKEVQVRVLRSSQRTHAGCSHLGANTHRIRSEGVGTADATRPPVSASWHRDKAPLGPQRSPARPRRRPHLDVEAGGSTERLDRQRRRPRWGGDPRRQSRDTGTDSGGVLTRLPAEAEGRSLPRLPAVLSRGASGPGPP